MRYPRYEILGTLKSRFYKAYRNDLRKHDAYIVLTDEYKKTLIRVLKNVDENKIVVINNMEYPVTDINFSNRCKQFLYVGRLSYADKRVDRLVEAWKMICHKLPDWQLTIVGDGAELSSLKNMAKALPRIIFKGFCNDTAPFYRTASALCLTSKCESWGLVLTEAQANGVIPIAMDCSAGVRCIVEPDGVNGFLVDNGDIKEFADKMLYFANLSEEEKLSLRHNVMKKAQDYNPSVIVKKWDTLFSSLTQ